MMKKLLACVGLTLLLVVAGATVSNSASQVPGAGTWTGQGWSLGQGSDSTQSKPKNVSFKIDVQDKRGNLIKGSLSVTNPSNGNQENYDFTGMVNGGTDLKIFGNTTGDWPATGIMMGFGSITQSGKKIALQLLTPDKSSVAVTVTK